ncbi:MAG: chemotaxis protein CheA [Acidobacteriaceae bacterium]
MPEAAERANASGPLHERIDELTTRWMVEGAASILPEELESLGEDAEASGHAQGASLARSLAEKVRAGVPEAGGKGHPLGEGLAQVKEALSQPGRVLKTPQEGPSSQSAGTPAALPSTQELAQSFAQDKELLTDFVLEAREHLEQIEQHALALEKDPTAAESIHSVFRAFHTIKGLAGFLDLGAIQKLSHAVEDLLDRVRNAKIVVTPTIVDVVLESADHLKNEISAIEQKNAGAAPGPPIDHQRLLSKIQQIIANGDAPTGPALPPAPGPKDGPGPPAGTPKPTSATAPSAPATLQGQADKSVPASAQTTKTPDAFSVRVETAKLDTLMDMVGEMVIAQTILCHDPLLAASKDPRLLGEIMQLTRVTTEVQRAAMGMRMVPIGQLFQRTARLVRDLSRKAGKQVVLEVAGEDTEVDKTIAEELSDPLLHMVRNSIDHGIELPEERASAGKGPTAHIRLSAYHQAGQIVVEVSDDGRGLDRKKILAKALQNRMVQADDHPSDAEVCQLIFEPGFTTAEQVTGVSGRGVGMDVVRRNVQKLRGRIEGQSTPGQGTTFFVRLPLTLAIIEGLVVVVGSSRFIVPIFAVREMFRPTPRMLSTVQGRDEMALVRGRPLPIVRLHRRFALATAVVDPCQGLLVVVDSGDQQFCLLVDDLIGKQEVVIKGLGETFKDVSGLAGCAILGDGRVGLILDMDGIYRGKAR